MPRRACPGPREPSKSVSVRRWHRAAVLWVAFGGVPVLAGCNTGVPDAPGAGGPREDCGPDGATAPRQPLEGERVEVPGGSFWAGSTPGSEGRQPGIEPVRYLVELGPFQIDRLPFPNDPRSAPTVNVTREQAERLCAERGARLCSELEWERACKGPASDVYSGGPRWMPQCGQEPESCASGFDVLAMGAVVREWTRSEVLPTQRDGKRGAAVRGAHSTAPGPDHRCARRQPVAPDTRSHDLGFRCCGGAPNGAVVREPALGPTFTKIRLTAERLEKLLRSDPRTEHLAKDVKLFREPDAAETVVTRGPGDRQGFSFTVSPLIWKPAAGTQYLLVAAQSQQKVSFVLSYHFLGEDQYSLLSSFVMLDEPGPVAFAYSGYIRPRLHFSTCWGCPGENGKILFRQPDSVVLLQP